MQIQEGGRWFGHHDGRGQWQKARVDHVVRHPESPHSFRADRLKVKIPTLDAAGVAADKPVVGRLNHNRWIADCPECGGAEFVFLDQPFFWCANCCNVGASHKWRPILMPKNRVLLERILMARPLPHNRNWSPGESMASLRKENREHGLPEEVM